MSKANLQVSKRPTGRIIWWGGPHAYMGHMLAGYVILVIIINS